MANDHTQVESFFFDAFVSYAGNVNEISYVPWVSDFDNVPDTLLLAVLTTDFGAYTTGLYYKIGAGNFQWTKVVDYYRLVELFNGGGKLTVYVNNLTNLTPDAGSVLFRNGAEIAATVVPASPHDIWVAAFSDANSTVRKPTDTGTTGVLQVSDGPFKIKDYAPPPPGGIVLVDGAGVVSVVGPIELRSGGGLLIGHILP
jgi:hypothetical protein